MDQKLEGLFRKLEQAVKHDAEATALFLQVRKEVNELATFAKYHLDMGEVHRKKMEAQQRVTENVQKALKGFSGAFVPVIKAMNEFHQLEKDASQKG
jgi:hypothetical protein